MKPLTQAERERVRRVRHDASNALTIARANLEGMADGVVEITPDRIKAVAESIARAGELLDELP